MSTLTIEVDEQLLARVQELARFSDVSVAEMARRLLAVRAERPLPDEEIAPSTRIASGLGASMTDAEVAQTLEEQRIKKYGGR